MHISLIVSLSFLSFICYCLLFFVPLIFHCWRESKMSLSLSSFYILLMCVFFYFFSLGFLNLEFDSRLRWSIVLIFLISPIVWIWFFSFDISLLLELNITLLSEPAAHLFKSFLLFGFDLFFVHFLVNLSLFFILLDISLLQLFCISLYL